MVLQTNLNHCVVIYMGDTLDYLYHLHLLKNDLVMQQNPEDFVVLV